MDTGSDIYLVQAVSNSHKNSKPCQPASCEDTAAATAPTVRKAVRTHSTLLATLIIIIFYLLFALFEHIFEGLGMLENLARISEVPKIAI